MEVLNRSALLNAVGLAGGPESGHSVPVAVFAVRSAYRVCLPCSTCTQVVLDSGYRAQYAVCRYVMRREMGSGVYRETTGSVLPVSYSSCATICDYRASCTSLFV